MVPVEPPIETPATLAEAYAVLAGSTVDATITPIAGGTDVMVRINGEIGEPPTRMVDLSRLVALRGIAVEGSSVVLGALTTYTEIRRSGVCREHVPALVEAAATIGAAQIQNRGTLGGNIANASPAGDTLPVLLALDAAIAVGGPRGERTVVADDFWVAYRRTALAPDELILSVRIPLAGGRETRFRKVGTRRAQAISKVVMALSWRESGPAGPGGPPTWTDVRLALGSVADRPIRARATEAILAGAAPIPETADAAAETLAAEIVPIDDVRSTADYRRAVAGRVLHRMIRDAGGW
jgi:CO/xanthine dehydrogenase FAD-binding subunit